MKSVMSHDFATTPKINAPRSSFDMSHGHKTAIDAGWLVPLYHQEVLPGDTISLDATVFARMATQQFPILDNLFCESQFFFVPYRLIWDNWRKFCGEQRDPSSSIDYTIPILEGVEASNSEPDLTTANGRCQALLNYMGVPDTIYPDQVDISALPFRAYGLIYNEWYRDQNLINTDDPGALTNDGPDDIDLVGERHRLQRRGKRRDYFTQALPWPQKGDAVDLPLGTSAPITGFGVDAGTLGGSVATMRETDGTGSETYTNIMTGNYYIENDPNNSGYPNIRTDLTSATAATINDIREAFQIQKLLERDARSGTRYSELIKNHFNVDFYDVSYRPEYLGGGSSPVNIHPIAMTNNTSVLGTVGDLGANATITATGHGFNKTFVEHGLVMGIFSIRADLTYQQGLNRFFSHSTRYDKFWPSLAHLGEQAILNKEIYCDGSANDDLVFGYIPRYDEYRVNISKITNIFQSSAAQTLDAWHLSQEFGSLPTLGQTFIEETPPVDRVIMTSGEPQFLVDSYFKIRAARPIPTYGTPGMMDHF